MPSAPDAEVKAAEKSPVVVVCGKLGADPLSILVAAVRWVSLRDSDGSPAAFTLIDGPSSVMVSFAPRSRLAFWKSPSLSVIVAVKVTTPAARLMPSPVSGLLASDCFTARSSVKVTMPVLGSTAMVKAKAPVALPTCPSMVLPFKTSTSASPVCESTRPDAVPLPPTIDST